MRQSRLFAQTYREAPTGFAGTIGLNAPILVDRAIRAGGDWIAGGNERDVHVRGVRPGLNKHRS
ncbi:hypothetical protein ACF3MZ_13680 [Paenibacillaceae bacterium WGS1546]|uniref:hypothetical protein n=1 Tax=Cohnella sp. WGS1546 TaxID=3366810 RepID=UPI00372D26E7